MYMLTISICGKNDSVTRDGAFLDINFELLCKIIKFFAEDAAKHGERIRTKICKYDKPRNIGRARWGE